jgi:hypothetical protein
MIEPIHVKLSDGQQLLRERLPAVQQRLGRRLRHSAPASRPAACGGYGEAERQLDDLQDWLARAPELMAGPLARAADGGTALDAEAGLLELERFVDTGLTGLDRAERAAVGGGWRDSIVAVLRKLLGQVADWLERLVAALENPLSVVAIAGYPESGKATVELLLRLEAEAELARLAAALPSRLTTSTPGLPSAKRRGMGFWDWVLGIALGVWVGEALGDDE